MIYFNQKISRTKIVLDQHIGWTNKNSSLIIFAVQIFLGPKILIALKNFQAKILLNLKIVRSKIFLEAYHVFGIQKDF